jgi:hypothetical protein
VLDGIEFDRRGVPAAAICTDQFITSARTMSRVMGIPNYPVIFTAHPLGSLNMDQLRERAETIATQVVRLLREGNT